MPIYHEHRISSANALSLYIRDYLPQNKNRGNRPPKGVVLCLGGLTRNSKDFHKLAQRLSGNGYRVICPDYRGRGMSDYDPDWKNYHPRVYLDDTRHIITALNVHKFVVIGTSLGGLLGMAIGVAMPSSLCGVLINDVCPEIPTQGLQPVLAHMSDTTSLASWDQAIEKIQKTFPDFPAKSLEDWYEIAQNTYKIRDDGMLIHDWDPAIALPFQALAGRGEEDLWPLLRSLGNVPVALVRGSRSPFISDVNWQRMAEELPKSRRVVIEGVGHAPSLNEDDCRTLTDDWMTECFSKLKS